MRHDTTTTIANARSDFRRRIRLVKLALPCFYGAVIAATIIDGLIGGSLVAFWSLLLVLTMAFVLVRASRRWFRFDCLASRLWQLARCSASGATLGVGIGLLVILFGDGASTTVAGGLALASFSVFYGVLLALPAGCAVVWLDRDV